MTNLEKARQALARIEKSGKLGSLVEGYSFEGNAHDPGCTSGVPWSTKLDDSVGYAEDEEGQVIPWAVELGTDGQLYVAIWNGMCEDADICGPLTIEELEALADVLASEGE